MHFWGFGVLGLCRGTGRLQCCINRRNSKSITSALAPHKTPEASKNQSDPESDSKVTFGQNLKVTQK